MAPSVQHYFQAIVNSFGGIGTVCVVFDTLGSHTVYDLKLRLAQTTSIAVGQQRITTVGGHLLTDSHVLFADLQGPAIFNLSVSLRGGRSAILPDPTSFIQEDELLEHPEKKCRLNEPTSLPLRLHCTAESSSQSKKINERPTNTPEKTKGKERETRKRKQRE
ncbi:hypothetical protein J3Q64DRAFT_1160863 [Phycomyces blakesleeanus]|uniref:Ubiquitin-like domain-containing protein n=2 Tax=Phycomyces blakesleeanus TaxID=4837 RepID=A0A162U6L7_PHYB8|nr:hypothetical protein PHYBLDRAFT_169024 [Phycomyces blakesleeanus NRRL 1555(-)]OAD72763.1 hypothetical protein PHYBLDRAFT_169024 [Phycomyces blakesleeanus NRRL 1555(-)]|eukprot:XP_018290803.1 hypothetical protein PHYBLDRAFT_169024 [Phycomyces blakesleeanus NRRL 1555(-)]